MAPSMGRGVCKPCLDGRRGEERRGEENRGEENRGEERRKEERRGEERTGEERRGEGLGVLQEPLEEGDAVTFSIRLECLLSGLRVTM